MKDGPEAATTDLQDALNSSALASLKPLSTSLLVIFFVLIGFNLLDLPAVAVSPVVSLDIALVIIFGGLRLALGRGWINARWAHPVIAAVAALVIGNILLTFALLSEPFYTTYALIVVVGGGFFILSARWLIALAVGILAAWSVVAWFSSTTHQFVHYGFTLFVATTLSFAVHTMRIQTFRRLELLRLSNEQRKQELELALGAAERELLERRRAEERYRHLVQGIDAVVWEANPETGRFTFVSDYAVKVLGHPTDHWLAPDFWLRCIHPEDWEHAATFLDAWQQDEHPHGIDHPNELECRAHHADGHTVWLRVIVSLARDSDGRPLQLRGLMVNITERRQEEERRAQLEAQLLQSQKMEAVGRLAGGVAHDMNNMLAAIMNLAAAIKEEIGSDDALTKDVEGILRACERGRSLTRNMLGFARKGATVKRRLSINETIGEVVALLGRTIPKRIAVKCRLALDPLEIEGDPNQLQQVLINLALNAVDATPATGTLTISSANVRLEQDDLLSVPELEPGAYVELQVGDTGTGMDPEACERAFEPFFTTKEKGTGLGLAMVYGTIRSHGGHVFITSEPGLGTTVTIWIPAQQAAKAAAPPARNRDVVEPPPSPARRGTILLVDDEEMVRRSVRRVLKLLGFSVLLAKNGKAAVEQLRRRRGQIDLVILDLVMPVMDGHEAYRELRRIDPELRFIFSSGYSQGQETTSAIPSDGLFLQKPFDVNQLATTLEEIFPKDHARRTA